MIETCGQCDAERGPWEDGACPVIRAMYGRRLTTADLAVHVLEKSDVALGVYDIKRSIRRDFGIDVSEATLQVSISSDQRCCWAGRGLYGLYRHGFMPGPRSLAGVARMFLYSYGPLSHSALEFVMKYVGYRFQSASLNGALNRDPDIFWFAADGGWYWDTARTADATEALTRLRIAATTAELELVASRCGETIRVALAERERRLS